MKLIKRYANRKLYDTERSCYVTLDEIAEMVRDGEEVQIVDKQSGEDLTSVTLAQIVYEEEKKDPRNPLQMFRMMIQQPGELLQRLSKPVAEFREETQRRVGELRRRAETQQEELVAPLREFVDNIQRTLDDFADQLDERLKDSVDAMTHVPDITADMNEMRSRLQRLENEVNELRAVVERVGDDRPPRRKARSTKPTASEPRA